jgi:hypothetical protein
MAKVHSAGPSALTSKTFQQHIHAPAPVLVREGRRYGRSKCHYYNSRPIAEIARRWPADEDPDHENHPDKRVR